MLLFAVQCCWVCSSNLSANSIVLPASPLLCSQQALEGVVLIVDPRRFNMSACNPHAPSTSPSKQANIKPCCDAAVISWTCRMLLNPSGRPTELSYQQEGETVWTELLHKTGQPQIPVPPGKSGPVLPSRAQKLVVALLHQTPAQHEQGKDSSKAQKKYCCRVMGKTMEGVYSVAFDCRKIFSLNILGVRFKFVAPRRASWAPLVAAVPHSCWVQAGRWMQNESCTSRWMVQSEKISPCIFSE